MQEITVKQPNTVGEAQAIQEAENWRKFLEKTMHDSFRGFLIPFDDIKNLHEIHKDDDIIGVRGYMCLGDEKDISTLRLLLVPVNKDGKDILKMPLAGDAGQTTIYDFTQPCPKYCDKSSPLYVHDDPVKK